jgi:K+-sensing histidine kinase KdpD
MMSTSNQKLIERLQRETHVLTEVAKILTSPLDLTGLLQAIMDKIIGVLEPAEAGALMLWDQSSGLFRPFAAFGYDLEALVDVGLRAGESITGKVFDQGEALLLNSPESVSEAMDDLRPANRRAMLQSLDTDSLPVCTLAAPVSTSEQRYGVLVLETLNGPLVFSKADIPFVQTLADLIALAIDRSRLVAKTESVREKREGERMRSELVATLSHELRMPLTAIRGYATALLLDEVEWSQEKQDEFLHLIDEECENMQVLLTEILDSSLIEADQLRIKTQPLRLQQPAREICTEMQRRTDKHRLVVDLPPEFPSVQVDRHWIRQVFRNILDNAIKYSPDGGLIVIHGEVRRSNVVINIADQGIGISPEDLIPLFEKYFRVDSSSGLRVPGMGLGLPIARAIIEAHGGRIWVESKTGQGTTVSFSLPRPETNNMKPSQ